MTLTLNQLRKPEGLKKRKIIGRGNASGTGSTSGKGHKGQKARAGGGVRRGFEGGQMPISRVLPKRGFHNKWQKNVAEINIRYFAGIETATVVDPEFMIQAGLCKGTEDYIKIIGNTELTRAITVKAHKFSKGAKESIEKCGGKAEEINFD